MVHGEQFGHPRRWRGGFVLVAVLVLTCLLTVLVGRLTISTMTDLELSRARAQAVKNRAALESGIALARALLVLHRREAEVDTLDDPWREGALTFDQGGVAVTMGIEDEESKLPVVQLLEAHDPQDSRQFKKGLLHFIQRASTDLRLDGDDVRRWLVTNQFLLNLPADLADSILFEVPGSGGSPAAEALLTAWTDGVVNVNTASRECLLFLWGSEAKGLVEAVLTHRAGEPFVTPEEVFALPGGGRVLRPPKGVRLAAQSNVFTVSVQAHSGPSRACMRAVLVRRNGRVDVVFRQNVSEVELPAPARPLNLGNLAIAQRGSRGSPAAPCGVALQTEVRPLPPCM